MTDRKPAWGEEKLEAPKEFGSVTSLGTFQKAWKSVGGSKQNAWVMLIVGAIMLTVGIVMTLASGSALAFLPFGIFGFVFLPIGVVMMMGAGHRAAQVATYSQGFAAVVGSKVSLWPWDAITSITHQDRFISGKRTSWTDHRCVVQKQGGETVLVSSDLADAIGLIEVIKAHVRPKLLPPLQTAYDGGQPVNFGPITASRDFVESAGRRFDWKAIRNVVMKNGWLVVTPKDGKPLEIRTGKIPNVDLLCQLIGVTYAWTDLSYYFGAPRS